MEQKKREELKKTKCFTIKEIDFKLLTENLTRNEENLLRLLYGKTLDKDDELVFDGKSNELREKLDIIEKRALNFLRGNKKSPRDKIIDKLKSF